MENKKDEVNVYVNKKRLSCNGESESLGHPKVYLEMGQSDKVRCPYCDKIYILQKYSFLKL